MAYGRVLNTHNKRDNAIENAEGYPPEADAKVIAHEVSGTYESHTCVWPTVGETYSN